MNNFEIVFTKDGNTQTALFKAYSCILEAIALLKKNYGEDIKVISYQKITYH